MDTLTPGISQQNEEQKVIDYNKKIDAKPKLYPKDKDLNKRWHVKYNMPKPNGYGYKSIKVYGDINSFDTVPERVEAAKKLIKLIVKNKYNIITDSNEIKNHPILEICKKMNVRPTSRRAYVGKCNSFLKWLKKDKITELSGIAFLDYIQSFGKGAGTINTYRQQLSAIFAKAIKQKLIPITVNPFLHTSKIKHKPTGKLFFSEFQQTALKKILVKYPNLWLGVQLQYYCFIRNGPEMTSLIVADFDFTPGEEKILIRGEISKNKQTQFVAIPAQLLPSLEHLKNYDKRLYIFSKTGSPGTEQVNVKWFYNNHKKVEKNVGIQGNRFSFYSWKHTGIYMFIKSGGNLKQLQLQLRHHSLDQVNQYVTSFGLTDCGDIKDKFPTL